MSAAYQRKWKARNPERMAAIYERQKRKGYFCFVGMHNRCECPTNNRYASYGGRGISVCERWSGKNGWMNFVADMGPRPSLEHTLDRYPNKNGNYTPRNCRWATKRQQAQNTKATRVIKFRGKEKCLAEWAREIGVHPAALIYRLKRWPLERALAA
jgi:hypothetical protein